MAVAKKTGMLEKMKNAVTGIFGGGDKRKSAKRVAAGEKAASTRAMNEAATSTKKAVTATRSTARRTSKKVKPATKRPAKKSAR